MERAIGLNTTKRDSKKFISHSTFLENIKNEKSDIQKVMGIIR
jgi:hypothetical protein